MRLRSDVWVAAYLRRVAVEGAVAVLRRRGAAEAGAIYVKIDRLDGRAALFEPAPQSEFGERGVERLWSRAHKQEWVEPDFVEARMAREIAFDPDLWLVEVEDREGRCWLDLAAS
ncbi:MAG TPA: DUF1491 family protein [Roseiarcus sp.]|nr:DUF1491 family protein [Roseiarcus sp.]